MHLLIANNSVIPVHLYGGTERVIWYLGQALIAKGHKVSYLVEAGSHCEFAKVIIRNHSLSIEQQIPDDVDVVHLNYAPPNLEAIKKPFIITMHGNSNDLDLLHFNTVFVSADHAGRYGSNIFVHNGLNWDDYAKPELSRQRTAFHFLGNAAWRVKNVKGAIDVVRKTEHERLMVLGGQRFNFKMGLRFSFSPRISFHNQVGGVYKTDLINISKGLIFPVKWYEPFGLAIIESLYYGCPVFGTTYGSLPELVPKSVGFLANDANTLADAISQAESFNKKHCHEYARDIFNSEKMATRYIHFYETALDGKPLNPVAPRLQQLQQQKFLPWH